MSKLRQVSGNSSAGRNRAKTVYDDFGDSLGAGKGVLDSLDLCAHRGRPGQFWIAPRRALLDRGGRT